MLAHASAGEIPSWSAVRILSDDHRLDLLTLLKQEKIACVPHHGLFRAALKLSLQLLTCPKREPENLQY
jgi:hypothetical protein